MHFGDTPFGLPTNTDLEKVLKKNTEHTNPLEIKGYVGENGKEQMFPFWRPVKDDGMVVSTDYQMYWDKKDKVVHKMKNKENAKSPTEALKTFQDTSLLDKIKGLINSQKSSELHDNSGAVSAPANDMKNTSSTKPVTTVIADVPMEPVVEKAKAAKVPKGEKGNMGAVQPKSDMGTQAMPNMTKDSKKPKGDNVGAVKPKEENMKPNARDLNFEKYQTQSVKKSPYKKKK